MDRFDWLELRDEHPEQEEAPLTSRPKDGPSFHRAARALRRAGFFADAAQHYEKTVGLDEHNFVARVEWVDTLLRAEQVKAAGRCAEASIKAYRQVRPLYAAVALVLAHQRRVDEAKTFSQISLEGDQPSWYARAVQGDLILCEDVLRRDEAIQAFEQAFTVSNGYWEAYQHAGWAFMHAGLPVFAAPYFAEAAHHCPKACTPWLYLGDAFRDLHFYDQATFYYERVIELSPKHEVAQERLRTCAPLGYGLMRLFRREDLHRRWKQEYEKHFIEEEPMDL